MKSLFFSIALGALAWDAGAQPLQASKALIGDYFRELDRDLATSREPGDVRTVKQARILARLNPDEAMQVLSEIHRQAGVQGDRARMAAVRSDIVRVSGQYLKENSASRRGFEALMADPAASPEVLDLVGKPYCKAVLRANDRGELRQAGDLWRETLKGKGGPAAPGLRRELLRHLGANPEVEDPGLLIDSLGSRDGETAFHARWGMTKYLRRVEDQPRKDDLMERILAGAGSGSLDSNRLACLAALRSPRANDVLLQRLGGRLDQLPRLAQLQQGMNDIRLLRLLLDGYTADHYARLAAGAAVQASFVDLASLASGFFARGEDAYGFKLLKVDTRQAARFAAQVQRGMASPDPGVRTLAYSLIKFLPEGKRIQDELVEQHKGNPDRIVEIFNAINS